MEYEPLSKSLEMFGEMVIDRMKGNVPWTEREDFRQDLWVLLLDPCVRRARSPERYFLTAARNLRYARLRSRAEREQPAGDLADVEDPGCCEFLESSREPLREIYESGELLARVREVLARTGERPSRWTVRTAVSEIFSVSLLEAGSMLSRAERGEA